MNKYSEGFYKEGKLAIINENSFKALLVVGDLHGDINSLKNIKNLFDPSKHVLIFLGDYADRLENGIDVIDEVNNLIEKYPKRVIALKGNHEDYDNKGNPLFYPCTLKTEVKIRGLSWKRYFSNFLKKFIDKLFIAAIWPGKFLFVHGGVSSKIKSTKDLAWPSNEIEKDILWSDPSEIEGEKHNIYRNKGVLFGEKITKQVCDNLNIKFIIRGHQPAKSKYELKIEHNKVITINSCSLYGRPFILKLNKKINNIEEIKKNIIFLPESF